MRDLKDIKKVPPGMSPSDLDALRRIAGRVTLDIMGVAAFIMGLRCLWTMH